MSDGQRRPAARHAARPVVGLTGARFGGATGRRLREAADELAVEAAAPSPGEDQPAAALTCAPDSARPAEHADCVVDVVDEAEWDGSEQSYGLVRPYAWTRGRTSSRQDLAVEALISSTGRALDPSASPEHHAVLGLCTTPRSVAEVAALLSVPLGVARVLLGDMAETGSVMVHRTAGCANGAPDLALMERVLSCLRRL